QHAVGVGRGRPHQGLTRNQRSGPGNDGSAVLRQRAAGNRLDAERQRIAVHVVGVGGGQQRVVVDGNGRVFHAAGNRVDGGQRRSGVGSLHRHLHGRRG